MSATPAALRKKTGIPLQPQLLADLQDQPSLRDLQPVVEVDSPPSIALIDKWKLFIDLSYQRAPTTRASLKLIKAMAEGWSWQEYQPITVSSRNDGTFAVIDGGHRASAAWLVPAITQLPAMIVEAHDPAEQAQHFLKANTQRVNMTGLALFHARVAAGDGEAAEAGKAAKKAGVVILPSPRPISRLQVNETIAHKAIMVALRKSGEKALIPAMRAIVEAINEPGALRGTVIQGMAVAVAELQKAESFEYSRFVRLLHGRGAKDLESSAVGWGAKYGVPLAEAIGLMLVELYGRQK